MEKSELDINELKILEICEEPQSFESIKGFLGLDGKIVKRYISKMKRNGLLKESKGPTYDFFQITEKGKKLLDL